MFRSILAIAIGGALGSVARFLCQKLVYESSPHTFPFGTLVVNLLGCLLIGLFFGWFDRVNWLSPEWRLFLTTGFCGGFTTFSTFALENMTLLKSGHIAYFIIYTACSVVLGIGLTFSGIALLK